MFYCENCHEVFEEPERVVDFCIDGVPRYISTCPICGSDEISEAEKCPICGEYGNGLCENCDDTLTDWARTLRERIIKECIEYHFDPEEVFEEIKERI